jgi:uncharacterized membrane protein YeaQ/YmgE (transglycosylase-associated protein family)
MSWLSAIFIGLIVGFIARALKPGKDALGWIMTALLGIGGSVLATIVGQQMGFYQVGQPAGWIASVIGAIVLLVIVGMVNKKEK